MDERDEIRQQLSVSRLQAKRELLEIERTALLHEITSPLTGQDRREQLFERRAELAAQLAEITKQLTTEK